MPCRDLVDGARACCARPTHPAIATITVADVSLQHAARVVMPSAHHAGASSSACRINTPGVSASRLLRQRDVTAGGWTPTAALSELDHHYHRRCRRSRRAAYAPRWGGRTAIAGRVGAVVGAALVAAALSAAPVRAALVRPRPAIATMAVANVRHPPAARVVILSAYCAGASSPACWLTVPGVGASRLQRQRDVTTGGRTPTSTSIPTKAPAPAPVTQEPT